MTLGKKVFSQLFHTSPPRQSTSGLWARSICRCVSLIKWNTPIKTDTENTPFANRTLKYRLNTKLAIFNQVLIKGHEKYRAIRPPATSTAICPTHAEGGERTWPCLREQGVLINMTRQRRNKRRAANRCKTHQSLPFCPICRFLGKSSFPPLPFFKSISAGMTSKTKSCWHISAGV